MPSAMRSTNFCYCFVRAAIHSVVTRQRAGQSNPKTSLDDDIICSDEIEEKLDEHNRSSTVEEFESVFPVAYEKSSKINKYGSAPVYIIGGVPTPIAQDEHYACRGNDLKILSLYEYSSIISVIKKDNRSNKKKSNFCFVYYV